MRKCYGKREIRKIKSSVSKYESRFDCVMRNKLDPIDLEQANSGRNLVGYSCHKDCMRERRSCIIR